MEASVQWITRAAKRLWLGVVVLVATVNSSKALPDTIRVGALFEPENTGQRLAFENAIEKVNLRNDILPHTLLIYDVQDVQAQDSFHASKKVCQQLEKGIAAVFGPLSSSSAAHVQSICYALEIPHLQTRWDSRDIKDIDYFSINLYPHYLTLSRAYLGLVSYWKWKRFTILYESNEGLVRLQEVLNAASKNKFEITVRKLTLVDGKYIAQLKDIKSQGESRVLVDCKTETVYPLLKQALQVTMLSEYFHFFFTTLDLDLIELEEFKYGGANITGLRIVDPLRPLVMDVTSDWVLEETRTGKSPIKGLREIPTETALMYDAVILFASGLHQVADARDISTAALSCTKQNSWTHGNSLLNYMKTVNFEGLSGKVKFDSHGERSEFQLDVVKLNVTGLKKIGEWNSKTGTNLTESVIQNKKEIKRALSNSTLKVVTKLELPYVRNKTGPGGKVEYEGFAIDLLNAIADRLKFNYTIYIVKDGRYGDEIEEGKWDGMVGELIDRNADLAVAGMSITFKRERVIDFTKPFLNLGITILIKKPKKEPPKLFSFLSPLSSEVWVYMIAAYLVVSFMLYIIARLSPYEWFESSPGSDELDNQFTILNSLWFTIGCLMQQGSEVAPRAVSTRIVSGMWWFFTLIMISSYTANLAAFLTIDRLVTPIESAEDLAKQTDIKYGTLSSGSSKDFFRTSELPIYKTMRNFMETTKPSVYVSSTEEAVERVRKEKYAYLGESTTIDYQVQRECDLIQVGGLLDSKGYGLATPRGSIYRDMISEQILKLQEDQLINKFYIRWWKEKADSKCVKEETSKKTANELGLLNVGGVFVVLIGGVGGGMVMAILEFLWKAWMNSRSDKQPFCSEVSQELRVAVTCLGSSRKNGNRKRDDAMLDNNLHLMPLTGIMSGHNSVSKDVYT